MIPVVTTVLPQYILYSSLFGPKKPHSTIIESKTTTEKNENKTHTKPLQLYAKAQTYQHIISNFRNRLTVCSAWRLNIIHYRIILRHTAQPLHSLCSLGAFQLSPNSTWLVTSRHVSTRHDTFDVSSASRRACRHSQNAWARHVERVVLCR